MNVTDYSVFGLTIRSEIVLPELHQSTTGGKPDVMIRRGEAGRSDVTGEANEADAFILRVPEVALYSVEGGSIITVRPDEGAAERNVRLYLLGSALGALLHQRGLLPLHANAIEMNGRAVAFMGESGAGKSTLASWFHDRGYKVISDDVCVVKTVEERAIAMPGIPRLRLWQDALERSGRATSDFERSYVSPEDEKFDVPLNAGALVHEPVALAGIFELSRGPSLNIVPLQGLEAAEAISAHTYRGALVKSIGAPVSFWSAVLKLVQTVPVFRVERPWDSGSSMGNFEEMVLASIDTAGAEPAR